MVESKPFMVLEEMHMGSEEKVKTVSLQSNPIPISSIFKSLSRNILGTRVPQASSKARI